MKSLLSKLKNFFCKDRFATYYSLLGLYISLCLIIRFSFLIWSFADVQFNIIAILRAFITGFIFDLTTGLAFFSPYLFYLWLAPKRLIGTLFDKIISICCLALTLFIVFFSLIAEYPFWDEFGVRFNFIAVDYLIYTYEVVENINQSMPIPIILSILISVIGLCFYLFKKLHISHKTYNNKLNFLNRTGIAIPLLILGLGLLVSLKNKQADFSNNQTINEISKNGTFSFFAAFRSNELDYNSFYPKVDDKLAYQTVRNSLKQNNQTVLNQDWDNINRQLNGKDEKHPNIILISIESFSAEFLKSFGNSENLTPIYDSLANESVFFTNLYATGTRTVRGMEALTLCVPPTPGNSIVRRQDNEAIFSIATILKAKNYHPFFIYGGDGYFDNMNTFFGGQGFDIVDRDRGNPLSDKIKTKRYKITDEEVKFENAWGICDEDLYQQSLKYADLSYKEKKPFFQFVMTTSNHKPFTYPDNKISIPQGSRAGALRYTDFALGQFLERAKTKPWFKNTVFVVVADHCASSAGKWEINIDKHHIPAIFYNLEHKAEKISRLTSQIDVMPTLFGYLGWTYNSVLYGRDMNQINEGEERAYIGNYRTLGVLQNKIFTQIDDRKRIKQFEVKDEDKTLVERKNLDENLAQETISFYQTAAERFKNGKMKEKKQ